MTVPVSMPTAPPLEGCVNRWHSWKHLKCWRRLHTLILFLEMRVIWVVAITFFFHGASKNSRDACVLNHCFDGACFSWRFKHTFNRPVTTPSTSGHPPLRSPPHVLSLSPVSDGLEECQQRGPVQCTGWPRSVRLHVHQPDGRKGGAGGGIEAHPWRAALHVRFEAGGEGGRQSGEAHQHPN